MKGDVNRSDFWADIYRAKDDGWDLGGAAPPLESLLKSDPPTPSGGKVAVVGCGRGHDARLFARAGYATWGFDFVPYAIDEGRRLAAEEGLDINYEVRDVFALPDAYPGHFDVVWEYTCYCAIDPSRRDEYLSVLHRIIAPGGMLLGLFYPLQEGTDGPPFPSTDEDLRRRLEGKFRILSYETPSGSITPRQDKERLVRASPR